MEEERIEEITPDEIEKVEDTFDFTALITPEVGIESNVKELTEYIAKISQAYVGVPITAANKAVAKSTRASLNKFKDAIGKKVSSLRTELLAPYDKFKEQVAKACQPIDTIIKSIDDGIKALEEKEKEAKKFDVINLKAEILKEINPELESVMSDYWNERWTNATMSIKAIKDEITNTAQSVMAALDAIKGHKHEAQLYSKLQQTWNYAEVKKLKDQMEEEDKRLEELRQTALSKKGSAIPATPDALAPVPMLIATFNLCGTAKDLKAFLDRAKYYGVAFKRVSDTRKATDEEIERYKAKEIKA